MLMQAAHAGLPDVVTALMDAGQDPAEADSAGRTALLLAASGAYRDSQAAVIRLLLARGADPTRLDNQCASVLARLQQNHPALAADMAKELAVPTAVLERCRSTQAARNAERRAEANRERP